MLSKPTKERVMMLSRDLEGAIHSGRKAAVVLVSTISTYVLTKPVDRLVTGEKPKQEVDTAHQVADEAATLTERRTDLVSLRGQLPKKL